MIFSLRWYNLGRGLAVGFALLCVYATFTRLYESFTPDRIEHKDFIQPYLMARAILDGVDPYQPLPCFAAHYLQFHNFTQFPHPTPHTPIMGILFVPIGFLSYKMAALVWLACDLALLFVCLQMLRRLVNGLSSRRAIFAAICLLGWFPIGEELVWGSINTLMLALLLASLFALKKGREYRAGALLGCVFALKLIVWPFLIYLALRRHWRALLAPGAVAVSANALAIAVLGFDIVTNYYLKIGSQVAAFYRTNDTNISMLVWGQRFFGGFGTHYHVPPLYASDAMLTLANFLIPAILTVSVIWLAMRARSLEVAFGLLLLLSILVGPVAWPHYMVMTLAPIAVTIDLLRELKWPRSLTCFAIVAGVLLFIPFTTMSALTTQFMTGVSADGLKIVPAWAGLFTLAPAVGMIALAWALWMCQSSLAMKLQAQSKSKSLRDQQTKVVSGGIDLAEAGKSL